MINNHMFRMFLGENVNDDSTARVNIYGGKYETKLKTDKKAWTEIAEKAVEFGYKSVLIEVADGVKFKSHPEIAVEGAWEVEELKEELAKLRNMGLTPYPKLNFSTAHDAWLGIYSRMVSTKKYYEVARELIHEVIDIFDKPEIFNLGLDEENCKSQVRYDYVCYRQFELYWHDYKFFLDCVREKGVRPWVAVDPYIVDKEKFLEYTDKDVVISPLYTGPFYEDASIRMVRPTDDPKNPNYEAYTRFKSFTDLPALGYEVIPTYSSLNKRLRVPRTVKYVNENLPEDKVKAFLIAPQLSTVMENRYRFFEEFSIIKHECSSK